MKRGGKKREGEREGPGISFMAAALTVLLGSQTLWVGSPSEVGKLTSAPGERGERGAPKDRCGKDPSPRNGGQASIDDDGLGWVASLHVIS